MNLAAPISWEQVPTRRLIDVALAYYPEVGAYKSRLVRFPNQETGVRRALIWRLKKLAIDPGDPFLPHPSREELAGDGIPIGQTHGGTEFIAGEGDLSNGALLIGSPKSGKSASGMHLVTEAHRRGIGTIWIELRADALVLASVLPDALVIPIRALRINLFAPPRGVPLRIWMPVIAARLTLDLNLQLASESFFIRMCEPLVEASEKRGALPTLLDFMHVLDMQRTKPRSSDESSLDRIKARLVTLLQLCGSGMFAVQRGHPIVEAAEAGRVVILDMRIDRIVADLLTSVLIYSLASGRLESRDPFAHRPVFIVFDEQRSLLRQRDTVPGIPDLDLFFSRSRALHVRPLILEQCPSQLSRAVLTAPRLRLLFNTGQPEAYFASQIFGLSPAQAAEIAKLRPGECIVSLLGEKTPHPFKVQVPFDPVRAQASTNRDSYEDAARRSLAELNRSVVPWVPLFQAQSTPKPPPKKPPQQEGPELSEDAGQVFFRIVRFPEELIEERTAALQMERGREWRARGQLETLGLIEDAGKVSKWEFFGPTEKGKQLAGQRGVSVAAFKSDLLHEIVLRRIVRGFGQTVQGVKFSRGGPIRGRQPDGFALLPGGFRIAIQVCNTNTAANEVGAATDMAREELLDRVVLVACERDKTRAIQRELQTLVETSSGKEVTSKLVAKVVVWDAATVLVDAFDWKTFASGPLPERTPARGSGETAGSDGEKAKEARDGTRA